MPLSFPSSPSVGQQSTQNGRTYSWSGAAWELVAASGGGGGGTDSRWGLFLPPAPTGLTGTGGNSQVALSWTAPTVLSQTPITDYTVQFSSNSGSTWTTFSDGTSTATSATVTGLTNGTAYVFRVAAVNGVGAGAYSSATSSVTPQPLLNVDYLLVGGGGGGGSFRGGGGGAGGVLFSSGNASANASLPVVVGLGGVGQTNTPSQNGQNSTFLLATGVITASGGGGGAQGLMGLVTGAPQNGNSGGSGGGGSGYSPVGSGGSGVGGQGNSGGAGDASGSTSGGGGGGGAAGSNNGQPGEGTAAHSAFLSAASAGVEISGQRWIAGGGAAGVYQLSQIIGGKGGGGNGGIFWESPRGGTEGSAGTNGTGGGGGGGGNEYNGGAGGSGIVILRVQDTYTATATTGSPDVYVTGGYRYYKFLASGSITFGVA